jgi:hypothetical protein
MDVNMHNWQRRKFLRKMSSLSLVPLLGGLQKFFPEINTVWAKSDAKMKAFLNIPEDLVMKAFEAEKASQVSLETLGKKESKTLLSGLVSFEPVIKEAHVTSLSWANGDQNALVVSIPLMNPQKRVATLISVTKDGVSEINLVEFLEDQNWTKAKIHTIKEGKVSSIDASAQATLSGASAAADTCTADILIQCLGLWGCSGLALSTCAAALILCPFTIFSCVAVYTCTLYCGGAWSYCFCWACGC